MFPLPRATHCGTGFLNSPQPDSLGGRAGPMSGTRPTSWRSSRPPPARGSDPMGAVDGEREPKKKWGPAWWRCRKVGEHGPKGPNGCHAQF